MGNMTDAERAEMYRRQLGGTQAALRRERQKVKDLESLIRDIVRLGKMKNAPAHEADARGMRRNIASRLQRFGFIDDVSTSAD